MAEATSIDFPPPPKISGNAAADLAVLVEYLWNFYTQAILSRGLVQTNDLGPQLQSQFLTLYALGVLTETGANKVPYFTGENQWALTALTDDARSLLSKDSVADMLTFLGITVYTTEQVQDDVAALIQNGTGITWVYSDAGNTLTPTVTITQYTDEMVDDRVAALIGNGFGINWTYTDAGNTLVADYTMPSYAKASLPDAAANVRRWIYVPDEAGGATPAFSDGAAWRRCSDLAVVS